MFDVGRVCGGDAYEECADTGIIAAENSDQYKADGGGESNNILGGVDIVTLLKLMGRNSEYVDSIKFDKNLKLIFVDHVKIKSLNWKLSLLSITHL